MDLRDQTMAPYIECRAELEEKSGRKTLKESRGRETQTNRQEKNGDEVMVDLGLLKRGQDGLRELRIKERQGQRHGDRGRKTWTQWA